VSILRGYTIPTIDLSGELDRWIIVDQEPGRYLGQPDTILLEDGETILAAYPRGHGGPDTLVKRSRDGGLTWSDRLEVPDSFTGPHNSPSIHRVIDPDGYKRLILITSYPIMQMAVSEDDGETWTELRRMLDRGSAWKRGYKGHAPPKSVIPVSDGRYLAMYHDHFETDTGEQVVTPFQTFSEEGGLAWSEQERIGQFPKFPGAHPCEPALIRSPDGKQVLCLLRENARKYNSLMMTSDDEGQTWSEMRELPGSLTGDRHVARYGPDGRIVVTFRDMTHESPTPGDFVAWVGTYEDLAEQREGQYRVRLLNNRGRVGDTGYAGLEVLPDGTFVSTTYCVLEDGDPPLVVSVRYTLDDIDARA